jgi:hypothetical protein
MALACDGAWLSQRLSRLARTGIYVQTRARGVRRSLTVVALGSDRTPAAPADLDSAARFSLLGQPVQGQAAHPGQAQ